MSDDVEKLRQQIAGLEAELTRVRADRTAVANEAKSLKGELATAQAAAKKAEGAVKALETKVAGIDAISESSAEAAAKVKALEGQLETQKTLSGRQLAMADKGLPKEARDYFGYQFDQQLAADPKADFDKFLSGALETPIAKTFLAAGAGQGSGDGQGAGDGSGQGQGGGSGAGDGQQGASSSQGAGGTGDGAGQGGQGGQGAGGLPSTQRGVTGAEPGAGSYTPGSVVKAAKENAAKFAEQHGIKLNNPERF